MDTPHVHTKQIHIVPRRNISISYQHIAVTGVYRSLSLSERLVFRNQFVIRVRVSSSLCRKMPPVKQPTQAIAYTLVGQQDSDCFSADEEDDAHCIAAHDPESGGAFVRRNGAMRRGKSELATLADSVNNETGVSKTHTQSPSHNACSRSL